MSIKGHYFWKKYVFIQPPFFYISIIRLQPLIFMDDVIRSSNNVINTNVGNMRLNRMVQELCLDIHPTKSCYLVIGGPNFKRRIQNEVEENPVMFGKILLKREQIVTYLGDEIHEDGLEASVEATIKARQGKVRGSLQALAALWGDYRMQVVGGVVGALEMFETCIISSLLNNSSTWIGITEQQEKKSDNSQYEFVRSLLHLPVSTPLACIRGATALMGMK